MTSLLPKFFDNNRSVRNVFSLRIAGLLTLAFFPVFWALDWFVIPDSVRLSGSLRLLCSLYGAFLVWATYRRRRWVRRHCRTLAFALALSLIWSISIMCWVHTGLESPYYAGINMVLIVITLMFSWSRNEALCFHFLVYGFYVSPFLMGLLPVHDFPTMLGNQLFLVSTQVLTFLSQERRVAAELRELTQRKALRSYLSQMRKIASTDSLTGLFNRRHMMDWGERELKRCLRFERPFSVIIGDIDWFKKINDTYGHRVGDEVIQAIGKLLKSSVRTIDIVCRYGGEEFVILLPEINGKGAAEIVCARISKQLNETPFSTSAGILKVTLSLGVAENQGKSSDLALLIHRADVALFEAKRAGRNRAVAWRADMEANSVAA